MYQVIELVVDWWAEVERFPGRLEQVRLPRGSRLRARVRPTATGKSKGPAKADLCLEDGGTALGVPYSSFTLVEETARAA